MIENIIKSTFGIDCEIKKIKIKGFALYMTTGREFYTVEMDGIGVVGEKRMQETH